MSNWRTRLVEMKQGQGLKAQLVRGVLGVGGLKLLSMPLTLGASVLLARGLGPEGYGQYVFVLSLITMLALPVGPGIGQLITREVAKYQHSEQWALFRGVLRRSNQWVVLAATFFLFVVVSAACWYAKWDANDRWTLLLIASLLVPLFGFNTIRSNTLQGLRHVVLAQLPDLLLRPAVHLVAAGILLFAGLLNPATALGAQIAGTGVAFLVGALFLKRKIPGKVRMSVPEYRTPEWGKAIMPFTLLAAVGTLNSQIGILVLGWLGQPEDVAALQIGMSGSALVVFFLALINLVISPHIIKAREEGDKVKLKMLSRYSARAALVGALPIGLPLIFIGDKIVHYFYGDEYINSAVLPLAILTAGQLFNVACGSVGQFLTMSGYEKDTLLGQAIALMASVALAVVLAPEFGAVGAASAVTAGLVIWNLVLAWLFKKRLGFMPTVIG
ncbi:flippase [Alcanivorax borkumensis]|uniref:flippase n=1 Tax=Alcanivorax borkumensis TaxID=59754 RepID=UPI003F4B32B5